MARDAADHRETRDPSDTLVGLSKRSSGSIAGVLAALTLLVLFAIAAFWAIGVEPDPAVVVQKADGAAQEIGKAATPGKPSRSESAPPP